MNTLTSPHPSIYLNTLIRIAQQSAAAISKVLR